MKPQIIMMTPERPTSIFYDMWIEAIKNKEKKCQADNQQNIKRDIAKI